MSKKVSLPIRLDDGLKSRLEKAATHLGHTPSSLLRHLAMTFVDKFEKSNGKITFPPEWK